MYLQIAQVIHIGESENETNTYGVPCKHTKKHGNFIAMTMANQLVKLMIEVNCTENTL